MSAEEQLSRLEDAIGDLLLVVTREQPDIRLTKMVDGRASSAGHRLLDLLDVIDAERQPRGPETHDRQMSRKCAQ